MVYDPAPPYTVRQTGAVDAATHAALSRVWRVTGTWSPIRGVSRRRWPLLLQGPSAFAAFLAFSDWLWQRHRQDTAKLTPEQLVDACLTT